jgi:tripartite ATP-independent transporter DctP family solute receptor
MNKHMMGTLRKGGGDMYSRTKILLAILVFVCMLGGFLVGTALAQKAKELAIAMHSARTEPIVWGIAKQIKETVEAETKGKIKVRLLGPEVGGERDLLEATSRGEYHMVQSGDMGIAYYAPKYAVTSVPFVFPDYTAVKKAYGGKLGEKLNGALAKNGNMRLIGLSKRGARLLTANKPVYSPADVKGIKLRVPEIATWVEAWKAVGALPTPVAWPEVFTALQTGVVDAQENPIAQIYEAKLYEVQKYIMLTQHLSAYFHWLINEKTYQGLDATTRNIILNAVGRATDWGTRQQEKKTAEQAVVIQKKHDVQIIVPNKYAFFDAAKPAIDRIAKKKWAPEVKQYLEEIVGK